jgi:hypothetical protein
MEPKEALTMSTLVFRSHMGGAKMPTLPRKAGQIKRRKPQLVAASGPPRARI